MAKLGDPLPMIDYYDDYDDLEEVPSNNQETTANHGGQQPEKEKP